MDGMFWGEILTRRCFRLCTKCGMCRAGGLLIRERLEMTQGIVM